MGMGVKKVLKETINKGTTIMAKECNEFLWFQGDTWQDLEKFFTKHDKF